MSTEPKTLFEKVWEQHVVVEPKGEPTLLYIDLQLVHEVTSPQAFEGLRLAGRKVRRPDRTIATVDHNVPTTIEGRLNIVDQIAATQIATLRKNCAEFGIELYDVDSREQGIVHVIGPELGITKPGMTIVCGDSHTSTHGAFGALAFGIGTSEVEHVLATQTLPQVQAEDLSHRGRRQAAAGRHGEGHHSGHHRQDRHGRRDRLRDRVRRLGDSRALDGRPHDGLQHEHRGRRARGHDRSRRNDFCVPEGPPLFAEGRGVGRGRAEWSKLPTDPGAKFDRELVIDAATLVPYVSWGTSPGMVAPITATVPDPATPRTRTSARGWSARSNTWV